MQQELFSPNTKNTGPKKIYTVSEITREVQRLLEPSFSDVWVEGEITNLSQSAKGHTYFSLKDEAPLLKCALFASSGRRVKFKLENGVKALCYGGISVYSPRGEYQLIVEKLEPQGIGALQLAFEQLKKKLEKEGLFDPRHKKPIPFLPDRIGVVTSLSGKAIRDILKVIEERFPESHVLVRETLVQGDEAAEDIASAIREFNAYGKVDVLLVGRGGGSLEDLWAFNEEPVARAIFASRIPIISCVGHELDYTIADFVADLRAGTPSMAAEQVVPDKLELLDRLEDQMHRLRAALLEKVTLLTERLRSHHEILLRQPDRLFQTHEQRLDDLTQQFRRKMETILGAGENRFAIQIEKLESLSPLKVLKRGYSVTLSADGNVLRSARSVSIGDKVRTRLLDGTLASRVESID